MSCKNQYAKSCIRVYNPVSQTVTATATPITLAGTPVVDSGCSLTLNPASIRVNKSGLYRFSADVIFNPTAAGTLVVQLYQDGIAIPSAIASDTAETGNLVPIHIETDLCLNVCRVNCPVIALVTSGVAGSVTNVSFGALKLA